MRKNKEFRKVHTRQMDLLPPIQPVRQRFGVQLVVVLVTALVIITAAWARARACGDFYVGLAAGRDIIETRMASLVNNDIWSFMTTDKVWFNQNWGTHLIFYLTYLVGNGRGELLLKGLLMAGMGWFIAMRCRQRGVDWPIAILAGGAAVAAARAFIDMRPNLMTLTIAPLMVWLLVRTRSNPHRIWWALGVSALWSNIHGGFILGLGMMGLWTVCWLVTHAFAKGIKSTLREYWPLPAATGAAIVIAATLTPFGIHNLTHPFLVGTEPEWRNISEWAPIHKGNFGSTWEFYTLVGMLSGLAVFSGLIYLLMRKKRNMPLKFDHLGLLVFSLCLCVVLLVMGMQWRPDKGFETHHLVVLFGSISVLLVGSLVGLILLGGLIGRGRGARRFQLEKFGPADVAILMFDLALTVVVMTMAIKARRFIPLGTYLIVPLVAVQLEWVFRVIRRWWLIVPVALAMLIPVILGPAPALWRLYRPDNPLYPARNTFDRMVLARRYPWKGTEFLNANNISGRVYQDWRWEGFMHWRSPQLKVIIGGRAQQVYDLSDFDLIRRITSRSEHQTLSRMGVHLVVVPSEKKYKKLIEAMVYGPKARWAHIYWNGGRIILADSSNPKFKELIRRAAMGELKYPTPEIAAISRAMCIISKVVKSDNKQVVSAFLKANALKPHIVAYKVLWDMNAKGKIDSKTLISYLEKQSKRLDEMPVDRSDGFITINCKRVVADMLFRLYARMGQNRMAARWQGVTSRVKNEMDEMKKRWR